MFRSDPYPLQYSEKMIKDGDEMTDSLSPLLDHPVAGRKEGDLPKVTWKNDTLQNLGFIPNSQDMKTTYIHPG